jgi:hypothetical protein
VDGEDLLAAEKVRRCHVDLAVEAARTEQRGVEVLQPVRSSHDHDLVRTAEAVELDEELVQGLVVLAIVTAPGAGRSNGVELVDEDDRGGILSRLCEELADPGGSETGEHLDKG